MSSARLSGLAAHEPAGAPRAGLAASSGPASRAPLTLAIALLLVCLYAAFAHGAVGPSAEERVQLALCAVAAAVVATWLRSGTISLRAPATVWVAMIMLAAFALWNGVTLAWSVSPDQTWVECNRAITYVIVLGLAVAIGASQARALNVIAYGFLAVCLVVTAYGLGQKLLPGLRIGGLIDLDQTAQLQRLQEPLGYWNALALFIAMGVPIALSLAVQRECRARVRVGALGAVVLMVEVIAFTYSRGGILALVCALAAFIALSGARLRSLMWLALAGLASLPPVLIGLLSHKLTGRGVVLDTREQAGLELIAVLGACLLLLALAGRRLVDLERSWRGSELQVRRIARTLVGLAAAGLVVGVAAMAVSHRGLGGTISHAWQSFTATRSTSVYDPHRLLSADSENRWVWWKEAAGAFSDRPLGGWGAGSFGVVHLLYRRDLLTVQQPHSVPLQFLAETGIVGVLLAFGAGALLVRAGVMAVRRRADRSARLLAAALLGGAVAYAVHQLYDWDWDIPGVTLPALLFLGSLGGSLAWGARAGASAASGPGTGTGTGPRGQDDSPLGRGRPGWLRPGRRTAVARGLGVVAAAIFLSAFAVSVVLPRLAATNASAALVTASTASGGQLAPALASALQSARLDPLSDAGLKAASTIARRLGHLAQARRYLLAAVRRDPTDGQAWAQLALADFAAGAASEGVSAAQRVRSLDPVGTAAIGLAEGAMLLIAPPAGSATATTTPSSAGPASPSAGAPPRAP